jgi:hypothetical protein
MTVISTCFASWKTPCSPAQTIWRPFSEGFQVKFPSFFKKEGRIRESKPVRPRPPPTNDDPANNDEILRLTRQLQESQFLLNRRPISGVTTPASSARTALLEQKQIFADLRPTDAKLRAKYDQLQSKYQAKKTEWEILDLRQ